MNIVLKYLVYSIYSSPMYLLGGLFPFIGNCWSFVIKYLLIEDLLLVYWKISNKQMHF